MKIKLIIVVFGLLFSTNLIAQDCKICGVWNGAFKSVFPSGEKYRVNVEFTINSIKNFEYRLKPDGFGVGDWGSSENVNFVDDACNDHFIKYYVKGEDDDWQTGQKFKGRRIGNCVMHSYTTLELQEDGKTLIYRRLGRNYFYYDLDGDYIGKEWKDGPDDTFVCILHQLED